MWQHGRQYGFTSLTGMTMIAILVISGLFALYFGIKYVLICGVVTVLIVAMVINYREGHPNNP